MAFSHRFFIIFSLHASMMVAFSLGTTMGQSYAAEGGAASEGDVDTTVGPYQYTLLPPLGSPLVPFEFHGHLRTGFGVNEKGGDQDVFWLPMAGGSYRLGNETGTYGELHFIKNWGGANSPYIRVQVGINFQSNSNMYWESDHRLSARDAYILIGNFVDTAPELKIWAGHRTYLLHNIYLNQFSPFDVGGYGGGFDDINVCFGLLSFAYIGASRDMFQLAGSGKTFTGTDLGRITRHSLDINLREVELPGGRGLFWLNAAYMPGGRLYENYQPVSPDAEIPKMSSGWGIAGGFMHTSYNFFGGTNKFLVQAGRGINFSLRYMNESVDDLPADYVQDAWRIRIAEYFDIHPNEDFSMMAAAIYEYTRKGFNIHWASAGLSPIWHITKVMGIALDGGIDYVQHFNPQDPNWNFSGYLTKFAIAPQVAIENNFWSRPLVRMYASVARWDEGLRQSTTIARRIGDVAHENKNWGMGFGIQAEAWW
jgi:maltoporin